MPSPKRKTVTFVIEITARLNEGVNPDDVVFNMDCGCIPPLDRNSWQAVGCTTGYTTIDSFDNDDEPED